MTHLYPYDHWLRTREAATLLATTQAALRGRIRFAAAHTPAGSPVVALGGGVVALRFGRTWRVCVPDPSAGGPIQSGDHNQQ